MHGAGSRAGDDVRPVSASLTLEEGTRSSTATRRSAAAARASRNRVDVRDNPIASRDPVLGAALEKAVGDALKDEGIGPVEVRFCLWRDGARAVSFVCKVEAPGDDASGTPPWRWWSWLSRRPDQLRDDLVRGLRARRQRLGYPGEPLRAFRKSRVRARSGRAC
jgi:hypothetical protein